MRLFLGQVFLPLTSRHDSFTLTLMLLAQLRNGRLVPEQLCIQTGGLQPPKHYQYGRAGLCKCIIGWKFSRAQIFVDLELFEKCYGINFIDLAAVVPTPEI